MDTVIPTEIDYKKYDYIHPDYKLSRVTQQTGGNTVTLTSAGGNDSIFEIPAKCFNLPESYLNFTGTVATGGALNFNWLHEAGIPWFQQVQLYTRSGLYLCDLQNAEHAVNMIGPVETKYEELVTNDPAIADDAASGYLGAWKPNNALITADDSVRPNNTTAKVNYREINYCEVQTTAATPMIGNFKIPLHSFKETILALNKDLYFGGEVIYLRFVWNSFSKIAWKGTDKTDPTAGAAAPSGLAISNLNLYLAIEQNQTIVNDIMEKVKTSGLTILVPYIYSNKASLTGTSQSITLRFNRGHGIKLRKIFHSVYNSAETINTAYERTNIAGATSVSSYYTLLDQNRLQEFNVDCTIGDDWMLQKNKLKGSLVLSYDQFGYQWIHIEDFIHMRCPMELPMKPDEQNLLCGVDLNSERKWDFFATTANATWIHYSFSVCDKLLTIGGGGISFV